MYRDEYPFKMLGWTDDGFIVKCRYFAQPEFDLSVLLMSSTVYYSWHQSSELFNAEGNFILHDVLLNRVCTVFSAVSCTRSQCAKLIYLLDAMQIARRLMKLQS